MNKRYFVIFWNYNCNNNEVNKNYKSIISELLNDIDNITFHNNEFGNVLLVETSDIEIDEEFLANKCREFFLINNKAYSGALGYFEIYVKEVMNLSPIFPTIKC